MCVGSRISIIVLVELKYRATLSARARDDARGDASSYDEIWKTFVADELKSRRYWASSAWGKAAMAGAEKRSKRQAAASVGVSLKRHARSSPWFLVSATAGRRLWSTKTVARAFQKAWRSYGGDYRRLCDVVRVFIAFESVDKLWACTCLLRRSADVSSSRGPLGVASIRNMIHTPANSSATGTCSSVRFKRREATGPGPTRHRDAAPLAGLRGDQACNSECRVVDREFLVRSLICVHAKRQIISQFASWRR